MANVHCRLIGIRHTRGCGLLVKFDTRYLRQVKISTIMSAMMRRLAPKLRTRTLCLSIDKRGIYDDDDDDDEQSSSSSTSKCISRQVVSQKFATFITTVFIVYMLTAKQKYPKGICAAFPDQATLVVCRSALRGPPERPFRSFFYGGPQTGFSLKRVCPFQTHSWEKPRGHITSFL